MPAIQEQADDQPAIPEAVFVVAVMYGVTDAFVRIDLHWNIAALVPLGLLIVDSAGLAMAIAGLILVWKRIPLLNDLALTLVMFGYAMTAEEMITGLMARTVSAHQCDVLDLQVLVQGVGAAFASAARGLHSRRARRHRSPAHG